MIRPDFADQPYIAEVLRTSANSSGALSALERLVEGKWNQEVIQDPAENQITVLHGFVASASPYHRTTRTITTPKGETVQVPRQKVIRRRDHYLYDLLVVQRGRHVVVAVPFHGLATRLFLEVDKILAGTRTMYEKLDITKMVIQLGSTGRMALVEGQRGDDIILTRCHLAYSDPAERRRDIDQVRLTGSNLGASEIYAGLIHPVLNPVKVGLTVTPVLLGFALFSGGIRKSSATTDRHGNFKISVGAGLRQATRLFQLLDGIERMEGVASITSNVPILQSGSIEGAE
jgi:hypothetical protein